MKRLFVFVFAVVLLVSCNNSQQNQRVIELLEKIDKKLLDNKLSKEKEVIDSIEYKTVFVQFDRLLVYNGNAPERGNMYKKAESKVSELLNNGWQIISTSNVIYSQRYEPKGFSAYFENNTEPVVPPNKYRTFLLDIIFILICFINISN